MKIFTIKNFLEEYDSGDLKFNDLQYRKGARITSPFGLTEGYRVLEDRVVWDSIRIHTGVDRSYHNRQDENIVVAPFEFDRADYFDYGEQHVYGSVLRLFNDKYKFEMRIMHIYPHDLNEEILKGKIKRNTVIGKAGDYGSSSSGKHTHTEIISYEEKCTVLENLLKLKFGNKYNIPYTNEEILKIYTKQKFWEKKSELDIFMHYKILLQHRRIKNDVLNNFKYIYQDWYYGFGTKEQPRYHTRYSTQHLFNGL